MSEAVYKLEYWIDKTNYSKENLESKLSQDLRKLDINFKIKEEADYYIVIIKAGKNNINACHDHLNFDREEVFRAKDKLGDELRAKAYPILAEIETRLRRFITRAMIEVLDFNWWDRSTPEEIRKNVSRIEKQSGSNQADDHHQIEFTMFDDLITFVTGKYQKWADTKNLTPADLAELLDDCENIEELKQKLSHNREQTSLWDEVFSSYFDDPKGWKKLEGNIEDTVIPIRHKVMHHRLIRIHEVKQLKKHRDELFQIIGTAKPELPPADLNKAFNSLQALFKNINSQLNTAALKASKQFVLDPEIIEGIRKSARIDHNIIKAIQETPLIDPEILKGLKSGLDNRHDDPDNSDEDEEESSDDQNGEDDENDSEDYTNEQDDK